MYVPTAVLSGLSTAGLSGTQPQFALGYDATEAKGRRQPPSGILRDEDSELRDSQRRKLTSSSRDIHRNFVLAGWAIRCHLNYVSSYQFQAKSKDRGLNTEVEALVDELSEPANCDAAKRHSLSDMIRLAEARSVVDGDCGLVKIGNGTMQAIEGDRVRNPVGTFPAGLDPMRMIHGVYIGPAGEALAYAVNTRTCGGGFAFERMVPAANFIHHGYFDRFDQIRGITPLAAALNTMRDTYEGFDYALGKMKVAQFFGLATYRDSIQSPADLLYDDEGRPRINLGKGPALLDLGKDDKAEFLEARSPSNEFQSFSQSMIGLSIKSLDIPFSFYDESFTNYSGARQALLQYQLASAVRRNRIRSVLNDWTRWRLRLAIEDGLLSGRTLEDIPWLWIPTGIPWIDPAKETAADVMAIANGLKSRQRVAAERGYDWFEIIDERKDEDDYLESKGLSTAVTPAATIQVVEQDTNAKDAA